MAADQLKGESLVADSGVDDAPMLLLRPLKLPRDRVAPHPGPIRGRVADGDARGETPHPGPHLGLG